MDHCDIAEDTKSSPGCQVETEELSILFRQFKHLNTVTEHALRKNKPLFILNLKHEKSNSNTSVTQDRSESEHMCLQALSIRVFPVGTSIEISAGDDIQEEVKEAKEAPPSSSKSCVVPAASGNVISDSDLPEFVSA